MTRQQRIVDALAIPGNLFLVITLPELRRQGLSYLALYALQRIVEKADDGSGDRYSEQWLRGETGLKDYETSRACALLVKSDLVKASKDPDDHRVREFVPTPRGRRILLGILAKAGQRLWEGIQPLGRPRRVKETVEHLRAANRTLHGPLQLTIFDKPPSAKPPKQRRSSSPRGNQPRSA
jgi:DNA-binding MarR family transcriptional regulator